MSSTFTLLQGTSFPYLLTKPISLRVSVSTSALYTHIYIYLFYYENKQQAQQQQWLRLQMAIAIKADRPTDRASDQQQQKKLA